VSDDPGALRARILGLSREYARLVHGASRPAEEGSPAPAFEPGVTPVPYAARVFTEDEVAAAVAGGLDFWLTLGKAGEAFERQLASHLGVRSCVLANSGSSANLLAVTALTSPRLGERRLRPGDEVITAAAGFPTTVAPILQNGLVPVFVDSDPVTLNPRAEQVEAAWNPGRTRAVVLAHTLGNPFALSALVAFCRDRDLWLVEDNCDALGSLYDGEPTGAFGDLSTQSFYPPHHLTLGEGGAVNVVRDVRLQPIVESLRDWGRDCWCASGADDTCGKRFAWQLGELPEGYDHKYIYSHLGYNLKPLDIQAAIGLQQLRKLEGFTASRVRNWTRLRRDLDDLAEHFEFMLPTHATGWTRAGFGWDGSGHRAEPSWFGFMLRVRPDAPFSRTDLVRHLASRKIATRHLFGGNLVRQPVFVELRRDRPEAFRVCGELAGADDILNRALFLGVYPGLTSAMLDYVVEVVHDFVASRRRTRPSP
jgi:CDP-6-deoxy-D-xylo-4-hexulose-3-dehydrase